MAKTFNDIMLECENYHYSREHFDIMKECAEITLNEQYIMNQVFLQEHSSQFQGTSMDNDYFMESVQTESLQVLTEKTKAKSGSLLAKIYRGMLKIIQGFRNFIGKIKMQFDSTTQDAKEVVKALEKTVLDKEKEKQIRKVVNNARNKCPGFKPHSMQPFRRKINLDIENSDDREVTLRDSIAAALSDDKVVASVSITHEGSAVGALPIETLKKAAATFKTMKTEDMTAAVKMLSAKWGDCQLHGIEIHVIPSELKRAEDDLGEICDFFTTLTDELNAAGEFANKLAKSAADKVPGSGTNNTAGTSNKGSASNYYAGEFAKGTAKVTGTMESINGMINASVGASMRLYSDYLKYRKMVVSGLKPVLVGGSSADDSSDKK